METEGQWCDNAFCPDRGKIDTDNIKMHSYAERRFRCTTCQRTFSADKGTFFETLRTPRPILLDVVAMLVERNSLRAVSRIKHCKADTVLHWLDLAGQQWSTAGSVSQGMAPAGARAAKREVRVCARGRSVSHATIRSILMAAAMATCCKCVFATPQ